MAGHDGDLSPAHALARRTGTSVGRARDAIRTAGRLKSQPRLAEAARRGDLSPEQASAISDAAAANPGAEARLVEGASGSSLAQLRDDCERTKAAADADAYAAEGFLEMARAAAGAGVGARGGAGMGAGAGSGAASMGGTDAQPARSGPTPPCRVDDQPAGGGPGPNGSTGDGPVETAATLFADPAPAPAPAPPTRPGVVPTKVIVRIDWESLVRGWPEDGEVCEMTGMGPVPVSVVREMIASGDVFLAAVVTRGIDVASVVHLGRRPTAAQMTALQWMQPTCSVQGCDRIWLQSDHRHDWADTHVTLLRWLDRLCTAHHAMKTQKGWALVEGVGKRRFVPPDDTRHPRHPRHTAQSTHPPPG